MDRFRDKKWLCKVTKFARVFCAGCTISLIRRAWAVGAPMYEYLLYCVCMYVYTTMYVYVLLYYTIILCMYVCILLYVYTTIVLCMCVCILYYYTMYVYYVLCMCVCTILYTLCVYHYAHATVPLHYTLL